jgi:hypothetical protein
MARPISFLLVVMCSAHHHPPRPPPSLLFEGSIVIVCDAKGRPEERGGHDRSRRLEQSSERPYRKEHLRQRKLCQDVPSGHRHKCL